MIKYEIKCNEDLESDDYGEKEFIDFEILKGKTFKKIVVDKNRKDKDDRIIFVENDKDCYIMMHCQDCCEDVYIEDICGDLEDIEGSEVLLAELVSSSDKSKDKVPPPKEYYVEPDEDDYVPYLSYTWSFYKLSTIKGSVTIRWFGTSNGYYSEDVSCLKGKVVQKGG